MAEQRNYENALPSTADRVSGSATPIAPGVPEQPIETLVGRWLLLGCGATALVLVVAGLLLAWVVVAGVLER